MTCHSCRIEAVKAGKSRNQLQRYKCQQCGKRFTEPHAKPFGADVRLPKEKVEMILKCLVEGTSVRATGRLCGVEPKTVLAILKLAGESCERIMGRKVRNVKVGDIQADEMWGFVKKKEQHKSPLEAHDKSIGDAYTFVAIERDSKLVLNFALGRRDKATTDIFIEGLRDAVAPGSFQISTDGFAPYIKSIDDTFGERVDYAQIIKQYGNNFGTREKLPGFAHQKLPTKAGGGEPTYGMYHGRTAIKFRLVLTNLKRLRACGADDIDPAVSCPRARPVLQVGHSIRAQVGNFS